jgi:hypothetical protein
MAPLERALERPALILIDDVGQRLVGDIVLKRLASSEWRIRPGFRFCSHGVVLRRT